MEKEDARKQTLLELHTRRKQVVRLHRQGLGVMGIVKLSGLSWPAVNAALKLFNEGGWTALQPKARGKETGNGRALSKEQE